MSDYKFSAEDAGTGHWVELEIAPACERSYRYLESVWHKMSQAVQNAYKIAEDNGVPNWCAWKPHEWSRRVVPHRQRLVAWDGDVLAGFLNLLTDRVSVVDSKKPIVYVEHVASFPGNISTTLWERRLLKVGPALLAYAVLQAKQSGKELIGLHADNDAVTWYEKLDSEIGGLFAVKKTGVEGPYEGSVGQVYFETSLAGAESLLESYKDE